MATPNAEVGVQVTHDAQSLAGQRANDLPLSLLRPAAELFKTQGYGSTSVSTLAATYGFRKASLYHYIQTKEDLLFAICRHSLSQIDVAVRPVLEGCDSITEKTLTRAIKEHVASMLEDQSMHATMLVELRSLSPLNRKGVVEQRREYEDLWVRAIGHAQSARVLRADASPRMLSLALLNLLNWTIFWYEPGGALPPARLGHELAHTFLYGAIYREEASA